MQASSRHRQAGTIRRDRRWGYALAGCLLAILPALLVTFPPITDLPQLLAQVPLAGEALSAGAPEYRVQWLTPNKLGYLLLAGVWAALPPLATARVATAAVAAVWVLALHWLAARRRRSVGAASLAGFLLFNHVFYLGLFNFIIGLAVFVFWFEALDGDRVGRRSFGRTALVCGIGGLLLYLAHALWLIAGLGWLVLVTLWDRRPFRWQLAAAAGLAPTLVLVLLWYPSLAGAGWGSVNSYGPSVFARLSFAGLTNSTLGGLKGWLEPVAMLALLAWIGLGLWQHRRSLGASIDRRLLLAAVVFLLVGLVLPDKIDRTLRFASRWMPVGSALLLLALPAPAMRPAVRRGLAVAVLTIFCCATATAWRGFECDELRGFKTALDALPPKPRLLGLDFVRSSPRVKNPAYMHLPAYAQLLHGGRLGFSFVSMASSPVVKRDLANPDPWSPGLEWAPQLLRPTDLEHFDYALVHAPGDLSVNLMAQESRLTPLTAEAPWRLFRIDHSAPPKGAMSGDHDSPRRSRWIATAALALPALAIVRLAFVRFYQMDEFVFVRCAWMVAGGNVPYRDFFDHHTPLYYLLLSPVLALAPEGPAALTWARVAHLALLAAVIAVTARVARRLGGTQGAWLAILLLLTFNGYLARAIETRPEMLATLAFIGCAALLLAEPLPDWRRALAAGALATLAALSTQKALYYFWGLGLLWLLDLAAQLGWRRVGRSLGRPWAFAVGAALPAAAFVAILAAAGALPAFWRQNVELALSWQATELTFPASRYLAPLLAETPHWFLLMIAGAVALAIDPAARAATTPRQRRIYLALAVPAVISLVVNPIPWPYNFLPVFTILAPLTALVPVALTARIGARRGRRLTTLVGLLALVPFALQWRAELGRDNRSQRAELARVLALTEPQEPVFDTNGGYLFRPAANWYWYHSAAMRDLMREEMARMTIPQVRAAAPAAWIADPRFADLPANVRDFFRSSYLRHSGALLFWGGAYRSPAGGSERFDFEAIRDGRYFLQPSEGSVWEDVRTAIDGELIEPRRPFRLTRGTHTLTIERQPGGVALDFFVLWLPADGRPWQPLSGRPPPFYPHFF